MKVLFEMLNLVEGLNCEHEQTALNEGGRTNLQHDLQKLTQDSSIFIQIFADLAHFLSF